MRVAITGANGFVGRAVLSRMIKENIPVTAFVRDTGAQKLREAKVDIVSLLDRDSWSFALRNCTALVHCAGRAHVRKGWFADDLQEFREANTELTIALARSAAAVGVKRFVFISSIGVNGLTSGKSPFTPEAPVKPQTPYAISKYEAEQGLIEISKNTGLEVVVIRPPLVYGFQAPGNFGLLVRIMKQGWPLPLGAANQNLRSYVSIYNLVDLLFTVCKHPAAANQVFFVSDDYDISTTTLLKTLAYTMGKHSRLLPVPPVLLKLLAMMLGRRDLYIKLFEDLRVDISKTRHVLNWSPPQNFLHSMDIAIKAVDD